MGMILDPTPEMGEYCVEVRRESFYLMGAGRHSLHLYPDGSGERFDDIGTVEILLEDIPKIRAALDQVERYLKLRRGDIGLRETYERMQRGKGRPPPRREAASVSSIAAFLEGSPDPGQWVGIVLLVIAYLFARWCWRNRNRRDR